MQNVKASCRWRDGETDKNYGGLQLLRIIVSVAFLDHELSILDMRNWLSNNTQAEAAAP
jgi:hypothetical protein